MAPDLVQVYKPGIASLFEQDAAESQQLPLMRRPTMISPAPLGPLHFTIFPTAAEEVASHRRDKDAIGDDAETTAIDALTNCELLKGGLMKTRPYALGEVPPKGYSHD